MSSQSDLDAAHKTLYNAGLETRKAVTGPAHVERSLSSASSFSMPMQEYVTESCWQSIWSRPGLEHKTRSLLNIAMLCALNRSPELAVHVRGAVRNGASEEEIREVLLQVACYCGMPAGMEGFRVAERVLVEMKAEGGGAGAASETAAPTTGAGSSVGQPEVPSDPKANVGTKEAPVIVAEAKAEPQVEGGQSLNPS